jgi:hypothetical protein
VQRNAVTSAFTCLPWFCRWWLPTGGRNAGSVLATHGGADVISVDMVTTAHSSALDRGTAFKSAPATHSRSTLRCRAFLCQHERDAAPLTTQARSSRTHTDSTTRALSSLSASTFNDAGLNLLARNREHRRNLGPGP